MCIYLAHYNLICKLRHLEHTWPLEKKSMWSLHQWRCAPTTPYMYLSGSHQLETAATLPIIIGLCRDTLAPLHRFYRKFDKYRPMCMSTWNDIKDLCRVMEQVNSTCIPDHDSFIKHAIFDHMWWYDAKIRIVIILPFKTEKLKCSSTKLMYSWAIHVSNGIIDVLPHYYFCVLNISCCWQFTVYGQSCES